MNSPGDQILDLLGNHQPEGEPETADAARLRGLAASAADPWLRSIPLHATASALIVHPPSGRVLLRWHERQQGWLQVGGHGDPGETDPLGIALREGREESGLPDLAAWPDGRLRHLVVVNVPAGKGEPAHQHADLRFVLATGIPDAALAENPGAPLRWLTLAEAHEATSEANLRETLRRAGRLLAGPV
jgi:8-oxo-dGTP pyrophosphatase MutT (NUDIX family)